MCCAYLQESLERQKGPVVGPEFSTSVSKDNWTVCPIVLLIGENASARPPGEFEAACPIVLPVGENTSAWPPGDLGVYVSVVESLVLTVREIGAKSTDACLKIF